MFCLLVHSDSKPAGELPVSGYNTESSRPHQAGFRQGYHGCEEYYSGNNINQIVLKSHFDFHYDIVTAHFNLITNMTLTYYT